MCAMRADGGFNGMGTGAAGDARRPEAAQDLGARDEAEPLHQANAVTFTCADGYRQVFPLRWLLEHDALLADRVGGQSSKSVVGAANQLWLSGVPAKLFMRDVVSISFDLLDEEPPVPLFETQAMAFQNRPNVSAGPLDSPWGVRGFGTFAAGEEVRAGGYAYDYDRRIARVEVSLDGGDTWAVCPLPESQGFTARRWAYAFTPTRPGRYVLLARSTNEDGRVSPVPASWEFEVR